MKGLARYPGPRLGRWGSVRLRLTLWNVAELALILGALGGVVRYRVQADLFATVEVPAQRGIAGSCAQSSGPLGGPLDPGAMV